MSEETRTTTAEALLGLLSIKPMSGYEIKQMIEGSIGNFWSESFGQIYPTLKRLERGGWVAAEKAGGPRATGVRTSRRYRLTAAGCERLHAWLPLQAKPQVARNELLLKLFFGANAPVAAMRAHLEQALRHYAAEQERYERMGRQMAATRTELPGYPYWRMTLRYGQAEAQALVAWAEESLRTLDALEAKAAETT